MIYACTNFHFAAVSCDIIVYSFGQAPLHHGDVQNRIQWLLGKVSHKLVPHVFVFSGGVQPVPAKFACLRYITEFWYCRERKAVCIGRD